mgnify:CR=1 FL=1
MAREIVAGVCVCVVCVCVCFCASTDRCWLREGPVSLCIGVFQIDTTKGASLDKKVMEMIGHKIKAWGPSHHS